MGNVSVSLEAAKRIEVAFQEARDTVLAQGHPADLHAHLGGPLFIETDLLREHAWVILCSGFRERTIRKLFPNISICFCNWVSAEVIFDNREICRRTALDVFHNERKIDAIIRVADYVRSFGFETLRARIIRDPIRSLRLFDYIGPVTTFHLAKNLGFQVAKPDRHILRMSEAYGFQNVQEFCSLIAEITREPISVVDGVLWRISELGLSDQFNFGELAQLSRNADEKQMSRELAVEPVIS